MSSGVKTIEKNASNKNGVKRMVLSLIIIFLEIWFIIALFTNLNKYATWIEILTRVLALAAVLALYSMNKTSSMKMPWIILIMLAPIIGLGIYVVIGLNVHTLKMKKRYEHIDEILLPKLVEGSSGESTKQAGQRLHTYSGQFAGISDYLLRNSKYPVYQNTDIEYYGDAAEAIEVVKQELKKAKEFIFMEYHAIEEKESWLSIQEILAEKVKEGGEVRVFYDDMGSIGFVNTDFVKRLESHGIQGRVFNPFAPGLNAFLNNRDHRKITVIDGKVGFTGGYNIANEYFNITHPFGMWKDTGVKITGEAVRSLTVTFLENWNAVKEGDRDDVNFDKYLPKLPYEAKEDAFVQPYADLPLDDEHVGEEVYISMANKATKYCWFITPYLILTDEMIHAFGLAAKRGVDVRVITPGIPDKKLIYQVTRSYYNTLTRNGVRVYEWTPGFCHCKMSVADDVAATCGTINLDFRSLYHHFENGCYYLNCKAVTDTKADFDKTLKECTEVTEKYTTGRGAYLRLYQLILRLFAPLL